MTENSQIIYVFVIVCSLHHCKQIMLNNDEFGDGKNNNNETINHKQIRRSERIKKRIVNINPEDIGENDNENDEDYKSWKRENEG